MAHMMYLVVIICIFISGILLDSSFAQSSSVTIDKQTTLTGDLVNNPVAQDILRKIELTKQWILDLEKQEYEKLQAKEFLEEKRKTALERLNQDLLEWETLWANYTSKAAFERFVDKKPSSVQGVFWDQFEFKEMKVQAGRDALKQVFANGGTLAEAREAYLKAAETKKIELIEANAQFNVKHNLAYYKEQLLFNSTGHYTYTNSSMMTLNQYYEDYRTNPAYLKANPTDKFAAGYGQTLPDTKCREGYLVVHRIPPDDYTCVTEATAEMWIRYGIGEIPKSNSPFSNNANSVASKSASAKKPISEQIHDINQKILKINQEYDTQQIELISKYDKLYQEADLKAKLDEKKILQNYNSNKTMTSKEVSNQILEMRHIHDTKKDKILNEKIISLDDLRVEFERKMISITNESDNDPEIRMIWNSNIGSYEAVVR